MFDGALKARLDPIADRIAAPLARRGVSADQATVAGFALTLLAGGAIVAGAFALALALFIAARALDGLDGALARATRPTDRGGFLDIVLDFIGYGAVVLGFALHDPSENALAAAILLFAFFCTGSTFLATAIFAAKRGRTSAYAGRKSLYYAAGLAEGFETIVALALMCLFPGAFVPIALAFAALCAVSAAARIVTVLPALAPEPPAPAGVATIDSIAAVGPEHRGRIVVSGSHGGVSAARYALGGGVGAYVFNDAGGGRDGAGVAALTLLEAEGIAAVAVAASSARIGDARSTHEDGVVSGVNRPAAAAGVVPGEPARSAVRKLAGGGS